MNHLKIIFWLNNCNLKECFLLFMHQEIYLQVDLLVIKILFHLNKEHIMEILQFIINDKTILKQNTIVIIKFNKKNINNF